MEVATTPPSEWIVSGRKLSAVCHEKFVCNDSMLTFSTRSGAWSSESS